MTDSLARVRLLNGHVDEATAYVVDDYPYGFRLRCKIRYWIDTATKGAARGRSRVVSQTTNPKRAGETWNKPKRSTYHMLAGLYLNADDHVQYWTVGDYGITPVQYARMVYRGIPEQMTAKDREAFDLLLEISRRYAEPWDDWEATVSGLAEEIRAGIEPVIDEGTWRRASGGQRYLGIGTEPETYLRAARERLT